MIDTDLALLGAYACVLGMLGVFGLHRLYLVVMYLRHRDATGDGAQPTTWPRVTVQLPVYNELYVVGRLLDAVGELDYPRDRLEVQVLDDSDDETAQVIGRHVERLRDRGLRVRHVRRRSRNGFKAGALQAGLQEAAGELICVFDADFAPRPDFLRRAVVPFADPGVGMVQARWSHLNDSRSALTRVQALFLDAHFAIEHAARSRGGRFFNFNGTAGIWRRTAIEDAGGWQHDTLTEDLDLSYRAQLAGWRFVYLNDLEVPAQLPESVAAFKSQQRRWTRGAVQTARKVLPRLWRSAIPLATKVEATFHLTANLAYLLMVALAVLVFPAMIVRADAGARWLLWLELPVLLFGTGSVCLFFALAQREIGGSWRAAAVRLPFLMAVGAGLALNNTVAAIRGLGGAPGVFVRTPKPAVGAGSGVASGYWSGLGPLVWMEAVLAIYFTGAAVWAALHGMWVGLPVLVLFMGGYAYLALTGAWQARSRRAASAR